MTKQRVDFIHLVEFFHTGEFRHFLFFFFKFRIKHVCTSPMLSFGGAFPKKHIGQFVFKSLSLSLCLG